MSTWAWPSLNQSENFTIMQTDTQLTEMIIGAAYTVLNTLKPGLDEKLYERALVIELAKMGLKCDAQKQYPVHYREQLIGTLVPDLIVEERIVVDAKVVSDFNDSSFGPDARTFTGFKTSHQLANTLRVESNA
jgi:GxxExxY protein